MKLKLCLPYFSTLAAIALGSSEFVITSHSLKRGCWHHLAINLWLRGITAIIDIQDCENK